MPCAHMPCTPHPRPLSHSPTLPHAQLDFGLGLNGGAAAAKPPSTPETPAITPAPASSGVAAGGAALPVSSKPSSTAPAPAAPAAAGAAAGEEGEIDYDAFIRDTLLWWVPLFSPCFVVGAVSFPAHA